jgi:hypothetical protein
MSYSAILSDLQPYLYFPMTARTQDDVAIDFSNNSALEITGFFSYEHVNDFLGPFLHIFNGSVAEFTPLGDNLDQVSLGFWVLMTENTKSIVNIAGVDIEGDFSNGLIDVSVDSSVVASFEPREIVNFFVVIDNFSGNVYINGSLAASFSASSLENLVFTTIGELYFTEVTLFKDILTEQQILSLFNIGSTGSDIVRIDTQSQLSFFGDFKSQFQTVWQAYGIVTTKR